MRRAKPQDFRIENYRATHLPTGAVWCVDRDCHLTIRSAKPESLEYNYMDLQDMALKLLRERYKR